MCTMQRTIFMWYTTWNELNSNTISEHITLTSAAYTCWSICTLPSVRTRIGMTHAATANLVIRAVEIRSATLSWKGMKFVFTLKKTMASNFLLNLISIFLYIRYDRFFLLILLGITRKICEQLFPEMNPRLLYYIIVFFKWKYMYFFTGSYRLILMRLKVIIFVIDLPLFLNCCRKDKAYIWPLLNLNDQLNVTKIK